MSSLSFRGRIDSHIFETHNVTRPCPNILVWQTRQQRKRHDMAQKVRNYEDYNNRWEREEEIRRKPYDDERISNYEVNRYSRYHDLREKLDSKTRKKRNDDIVMGTRSRSYSRMRSEQLRGRSRSRSPRSPGVPGPSILKKRSQSAHGGGWGEDTVVSGQAWKRFRINAVDQVLEYSPSSDDIDDGCVGSEHEMGVDASKSDNEKLSDCKRRTLSTNMTSLIKKSPKLKEKVSTKKKNAVTKRMNSSSKVKKTTSVKKAKTPSSKTNGDNVPEDNAVNLQSAYNVLPVDDIHQTMADTLGNISPLDAEDSLVEATPSNEKTKAGLAESEFCNQNDIFGDGDFHGFDSVDINKNYLSEEDIHGYDVMTDLDLIDDNDNRLEDQNNAEDLKRDGRFTIIFSDAYDTRQVPCQHRDCRIKSTPSTLGLLPFSIKSGHEWLCPDHTKCLLCSDQVDNTNSVMCVMCARVFHTSHLQDLGFEEEDMKELVCKLCSDPGQFTPAQNQGCLSRKGAQKSQLAKIPKSNSSISTSGYVNKCGTTTKNLSKCGTTTKKEIMTTDHSLPSGWSRQIVTNSVNRKRVVITGPNARKYWSRRDLEKAFKHKNESVEWQSFSFSLYTSTNK